MRRAPLWNVCLMLVLLLLPAGVATASVAPDQQDFAELDAFVEQTMRASGLPGVALAIVRGDQVLHTRGFGDRKSVV